MRGHDETVVFAVADTGIGIAEEDQERIFQEWVQVEGNRQKAVKGTGLGLPLSQKVRAVAGRECLRQEPGGIGLDFFCRRFPFTSKAKPKLPTFPM